ncbi:hypothetical protein C8K44_110139 [Aminobacter sp. AP02]|nr:hypothetical protein C8K44_110139 [Aminobacter sp. AP02]
MIVNEVAEVRTLRANGNEAEQAMTPCSVFWE